MARKISFLLSEKEYKCLKDLRDIGKIRVMYDIGDRIKADFSEADICMAVFGGAGWIFAVINMEDSDLVFSDQPVKVVDDTVEIVDDVIAAVACMAGVKADTKLVVVDDTIINLCKLFKCPADLRTFSCHCFQCDVARSIAGKYFVEPFDDLCNACLSTCADVGAGVEDQCAALAGSSPLNLQLGEIRQRAQRFLALWNFPD